MAIRRSIFSKARQLSADRFSRNIGWLAVAELISRVGRIIAAIVLARQLDAAAFGVAAIALTVFELVRVFTENGIGAAVIKARDEELDRVANTAHKLMWRICLSLAFLQLLVGCVVEKLVPDQNLGLMIGTLSGVYLMMPFGLMHAYILLREQRMKRIATVASSQTVADHLMTAILALTGFGAWAIVLPKLLTAPIWLFGMRAGQPWMRNRAAGFEATDSILRFSLPVLGAELLTVCRDQLDKVIVSAAFGVEALGLYYFAFNAGLGVSSALNRAFSTAFYPHLCAAADKASHFRKAIASMIAPLGSAYLIQAAAALIYVPVVFGADWAGAASLVAVLCLGGPARLLFDASRMYCRAQGATRRELVTSAGFCAAAVAPFAVMSEAGLLAAAIASVAMASLFSASVAIALLQSRSASALGLSAPSQGA